MPFEDSLDDVILTEMEDLEELELGSDKYKVAVDGITKLMDRAIEIRKLDNAVENQNADRELERELKVRQIELDEEKVENDAADKACTRASEEKLRREQMRDDRIDKIARNVLTGFTFGGTMFTIWCLASATFTFEEKGTITSTLGRKVLGMLVPKI